MSDPTFTTSCGLRCFVRPSSPDSLVCVDDSTDSAFAFTANDVHGLLAFAAKHIKPWPSPSPVPTIPTPTDTQRLDWWFSHGLNDSVCEGSVDLWWADEQHDEERVTHGTSIRDALDRAMSGVYEEDE